MSLKPRERRTTVEPPTDLAVPNTVSRPHFLRRSSGSPSAKGSGSPLDTFGAAPRAPRYQSLDLWRGVACLFVVVIHSMFYANAWSAQAAPQDRSAMIAVTDRFWLGVPMFFVISGYCISATADAHRRQKRKIGNYFARRVRRIAPPYWCALAVTLLAVCLFDGVLSSGLFTDSIAGFPAPASLTAWQWFGNITLSESWRYLFVGGHPSYFLGHAWTLFYEEQFYIVSGLILALAPRRFFGAAALVTAFALVTRHAAPWAGVPVQGSFLDGHWLMFAAGILVYYRLNYATKLGQRLCDATLIVALAYALRDFDQVRTLPNSLDANLLVAVLFALLIVALRRWDATLAESALTRPFRFCGTICYSLYLIHWPICKAISHLWYEADVRGPWASVLVVVPSCMAASVVAGLAFHKLVERHFLNAPAR